MAKADLSPGVLSELEDRFGERMSVDPVKRYIYSRDMGEFPSIVGKLVGGLALRTYPSSAPSSTVGGWVAEGGSGIGAYAYGSLADNLLELKVVTPRGTVPVQGEDIDLYVGSEGLLGFIAEVRLAVRRAEPEIPILFNFNDPAAVQRFLDALKSSGLPIYHLQVITPQLASLKNQVSDKPYLPEDFYLVLAVLSVEDTPTHEDLAGLAADVGGRALEEETARREWEERLYPLRGKKAGPSVIPAEAEVPAAKVGKLLAATAKRLPELALEVVIGREGTAVCLGFIPCDYRTTDFTVRYTASLEFLRLAEKHHGAPYGIGLYFVDKADKRLGKRKRKLLEEAKREADPACLLNPGKILTACADTQRLVALRGMMAAAQLSLPLAIPARRLACPGGQAQVLKRGALEGHLA